MLVAQAWACGGPKRRSALIKALKFEILQQPGIAHVKHLLHLARNFLAVQNGLVTQTIDSGVFFSRNCMAGERAGDGRVWSLALLPRHDGSQIRQFRGVESIGHGAGR